MAVDIVHHARVHHRSNEQRISTFLEAATNCVCFGLQLNGTATPSEPIHYLRYMFNTSVDKTDRDIDMFHFISKALTCMGCDITTCCGQKCGYVNERFMSRHTHSCPFLLAFQRLNSFEVDFLFRETCYYIRKDIIDLNVDEYKGHFNLTCNLLTPGTRRWESKTFGSRSQMFVIDLQNLIRFNVYYNEDRLRESVRTIVDRFGIGRYCTLCRNEECHMFARCIVHQHYHAEVNAHDGSDYNNLCYVRESIDQLHYIEIENYFSSGLTHEAIEEINVELASEQFSLYHHYLEEESDNDTEIEDEADEEYQPDADEDGAESETETESET